MKKILLTIILLTTLSACSFEQSIDPFELKPEDPRVTLQGEIFPFDVSVSTQATHRLENNGSLAALLTSDIVKLDLFERKKVRVTGVKRTEKMREILVVEKVELVEPLVTEVLDKTEERFLAQDFTFLYPATWTYSTSPDGMAYFSSKDESIRRVFLKFAVQPVISTDKKSDLSIQIAGLTGIKDISTDEIDREVQKITLFSNVTDRKYIFEFTASFEDFEKKKAFFSLLNSFIEGESAVSDAKESDLKKEAEILEKKLNEEQKKLEIEALLKEATEIEIPEDASSNSLDSLLERVQSMVPRKDTEALEDLEADFLETIATKDSLIDSNLETEEGINPTVVETFSDDDPDFVNMVDDRAYFYESKAFGFSIKVPYGLWFRNFGSVGSSAMTMGFASYDFKTLEVADMALAIKAGARDSLEEMIQDGELVFSFPRNTETHFEFRGKADFRDEMLSIWQSMNVQ